MFLQRDTNIRKLQQQQYRQELQNTIQQKQMIKNKSRVVQAEPIGTFSLIKNIESEQEKRKNKQKQYYQQLQRQRLQQIQFKKRRVEQQKKKQIQIDLRIQRQKQVLRLRYQQQKKKQNKKKQKASQRVKQAQQEFIRKQQQKITKKDRTRRQADNNVRKNQASQSKFPHDSLDQINHHQDAQPHSEEYNNRINQQSPVYFAYPSRAQNQQFNFPQRRTISTNYYRQLQLEKRKFDEQTNEMRQLNRYIGAQKSNFIKRDNQGLQSLRQLQRILDSQNENIKLQYRNTNHYGETASRYKTQNQYIFNYNF